MTEREKQLAIAELRGWSNFEVANSMFSDEPNILCGTAPGWSHPDGKALHRVPDYPNSRDAITPVRLSVINSPLLRVEWLGFARSVVGRRCKKNSAGVPLVSDFDIAGITASEDCECVLRATGKWIELNYENTK